MTGSPCDIAMGVYRETWSYVRHLETARANLLNLIVTLSTAGAAFISLFRGENMQLLALVLSVFSFAVFMYFLASKRYYDRYVALIREIERQYGINIPSWEEVKAQTSFSKLLSKLLKLNNPFTWWLAMPLIFALMWLAIAIVILK